MTLILSTEFCVKVSRTLMAFLCLSTNICKSPYLEYKKKQMSTILRFFWHISFPSHYSGLGFPIVICCSIFCDQWFEVRGNCFEILVELFSVPFHTCLNFHFTVLLKIRYLLHSFKKKKKICKTLACKDIPSCMLSCQE
jgi:hypothetical protein